MAQANGRCDVYLEIGKKRTFAGAIAWPGWCRSGRDEEAALQACWRAFDAAVAAAAGRELEEIIRHVQEAEPAYLAQLGGKPVPGLDPEPARQAALLALQAAVRGELPLRGPRGGRRWTSRYFVRRMAWHVLDHAWEIEDRLV
jgi:hypothetical protein